MYTYRAYSVTRKVSLRTNEMTDTADSWHRGYRWLGLQLHMFVSVFVCVIVETTIMVLDLGKKVGTGVVWVQ